MDLWSQDPVDVRPVLTRERQDLLLLMDDLTSDEWHTTTAAPGWSVKGIALHLLDDDLGWLSRGRDGDRSGLLDPSDSITFVDALANKNQAWIDGARGLSRPVVRDLLAWAGKEMDAYYASMDLMADGGVIWASDQAVPVWFDIAQDLTERWVHQQQMREAVGKVDGYDDRYLPTVLRTFVWALPHQYRVAAAPETEVEVTLGNAGTWTLVSSNSARWHLDERHATAPAATVHLSDDAAWRMFTGAAFEREAVVITGDESLASPILAVRGIIV